MGRFCRCYAAEKLSSAKRACGFPARSKRCGVSVQLLGTQEPRRNQDLIGGLGTRYEIRIAPNGALEGGFRPSVSEICSSGSRPARRAAILARASMCSERLIVATFVTKKLAAEPGSKP